MVSPLQPSTRCGSFGLRKEFDCCTGSVKSDPSGRKDIGLCGETREPDFLWRHEGEALDRRTTTPWSGGVARPPEPADKGDTLRDCAEDFVTHEGSRPRASLTVLLAAALASHTIGIAKLSMTFEVTGAITATVESVSLWGGGVRSDANKGMGIVDAEGDADVVIPFGCGGVAYPPFERVREDVDVTSLRGDTGNP
mmetsp:Transcript_28664/g.78792  ORF Transcript_28664/g.78792 Transcript_28664/m.78792 type:complete len:196 (-) Transcript_28664:289-876(-)